MAGDHGRRAGGGVLEPVQQTGAGGEQHRPAEQAAAGADRDEQRDDADDEEHRQEEDVAALARHRCAARIADRDEHARAPPTATARPTTSNQRTVIVREPGRESEREQQAGRQQRLDEGHGGQLQGEPAEDLAGEHRGDAGPPEPVPDRNFSSCQRGQLGRRGLGGDPLLQDVAESRGRPRRQRRPRRPRAGVHSRSGESEPRTVDGEGSLALPLGVRGGGGCRHAIHSRRVARPA